MKVYTKVMRGIIAKLVLLVAVLIMPLGMTSAGASVHDSRAMANMPMPHDPDRSKHEQSGCVATCSMACASALPAQDVARDEAVSADHQLVTPMIAQSLNGLDPEVPAPPPKLA